jgi:hypothetical protein
MQAITELVMLLQPNPVFDKLLHPSDFRMCVTRLHIPCPASRAALSGSQVLDFSSQPMDMDELASFRDCLLPLPQVRTLKLDLLLPDLNIPIKLLSQILCAFENLEELYLKDLNYGEHQRSDVRPLYFGKMLKNSPWLGMLDISGLINLGLPDVHFTKHVQQEFLGAVAEARHASLRLNRIQINMPDFDVGGWAELGDLNGMEFVGV